ncbi:hypothetical protein ABT160_42765 [Streptomyces sp. NPDC001941]|uniref:hypothetical protein n=1 Tax=Streptomyces sp. NPDC001941 TaxID=3154659 RepID=UPI00331CA18E
MVSARPRTVRAVDTNQLLDLEQEAATLGFSQRLPVHWLRKHLDAEATHYVCPTIVHQLRHRPEVSPQWRCQLLLTVTTGEEIWGLLDVLPDTLDRLPNTLDAAVEKEIVNRLERATTQREWSERMSPEEMPRN